MDALPYRLRVVLELPVVMQDALHRLCVRRGQVLRELRLTEQRGDAVHHLDARAPEPRLHLLEVPEARFEDLTSGYSYGVK